MTQNARAGLLFSSLKSLSVDVLVHVVIVDCKSSLIVYIVHYFANGIIVLLHENEIAILEYYRIYSYSEIGSIKRTLNRSMFSKMYLTARITVRSVCFLLSDSLNGIFDILFLFVTHYIQVFSPSDRAGLIHDVFTLSW